MDNYSKESFYNSRLYQFSLTTDDEEDDRKSQKKALKRMSQEPLSEEVLKVGLSNIGKTASGDGYAFLTLKLNDCGIFTIRGVEKYIHVQQMDVSGNNIMSLKPLSALKYLTHLKASDNKLTKMNDFKAPNSLEELDLSNNEISQMGDMSVHKYLKRLNLNNNSIVRIEGLEKNSNLEVLHLNHNNIEEIHNLDNLNLTELYLFGNNIKYVFGLDKLPKLRVLDLSRNKIKKIKGLKDLVLLRKLFLSDNQISKIGSLNYLEALDDLSDLDLCYNPVQKRKYYRYQVIYKLPQLRSLDGVTIDEKEPVKAENFFGIDRDDRMRIFAKTLPEEEFVDRRIHKSEYLDPESDSDNDDLDFIDRYDTQGRVMRHDGSNKSERLGTKSNRSKIEAGSPYGTKRSVGSGSQPNSPNGTMSIKSGAFTVQTYN